MSLLLPRVASEFKRFSRRYLLLETWTPWLQCVMQDLADAARIKAAKYNIDALKDEHINNRWGSYKTLESEIKSFEKKLQDLGQEVVKFVVQKLKEDDLLCVCISFSCAHANPLFNSASAGITSF